MSSVEAGGTGLFNAITGRYNTFTVYTSKVQGEHKKAAVTVGVDGPSEPEIRFKTRDDGDVDVSFKPYEPGTYVLHVKHDDTRIRASPFTCKVVGERIKPPK